MLGAVINHCILAPHFLNEASSRPRASARSRRGRWLDQRAHDGDVGPAAFCLNWKSVARVRHVAQFLGKKADANDPMDKIEVPGSWFVAGYVGCGTGCVLSGITCSASTTGWASSPLLATFLLVVVSTRATGGPTSRRQTLSKITQLTFGAIAGQRAHEPHDGEHHRRRDEPRGRPAHRPQAAATCSARTRAASSSRQFFGVMAGSLIVAVTSSLIPDASARRRVAHAPAALV